MRRRIGERKSSAKVGTLLIKVLVSALIIGALISDDNNVESSSLRRHRRKHKPFASSRNSYVAQFVPQKANPPTNYLSGGNAFGGYVLPRVAQVQWSSKGVSPRQRLKHGLTHIGSHIGDHHHFPFGGVQQAPPLYTPLVQETPQVSSMSPKNNFLQTAHSRPKHNKKLQQTRVLVPVVAQPFGLGYPAQLVAYAATPVKVRGAHPNSRKRRHKKQKIKSPLRANKNAQWNAAANLMAATLNENLATGELEPTSQETQTTTTIAASSPASLDEESQVAVTSEPSDEPPAREATTSGAQTTEAAEVSPIAGAVEEEDPIVEWNGAQNSTLKPAPQADTIPSVSPLQSPSSDGSGQVDRTSTAGSGAKKQALATEAPQVVGANPAQVEPRPSAPSTPSPPVPADSQVVTDEPDPVVQSTLEKTEDEPEYGAASHGTDATSGTTPSVPAQEFGGSTETPAVSRQQQESPTRSDDLTPENDPTQTNSHASNSSSTTSGKSETSVDSAQTTTTASPQGRGSADARSHWRQLGRQVSARPRLGQNESQHSFAQGGDPTEPEADVTQESVDSVVKDATSSPSSTASVTEAPDPTVVESVGPPLPITGTTDQPTAEPAVAGSVASADTSEQQETTTVGPTSSAPIELASSSDSEQPAQAGVDENNNRKPPASPSVQLAEAEGASTVASADSASDSGTTEGPNQTGPAEKPDEDEAQSKAVSAPEDNPPMQQVPDETDPALAGAQKDPNSLNAVKFELETTTERSGQPIEPTSPTAPQTTNLEHKDEPVVSSSLPVESQTDSADESEQVKSSEQSEVSQPPDEQQEAHQTQPSLVEEPLAPSSTSQPPQTVDPNVKDEPANSSLPVESRTDSPDEVERLEPSEQLEVSRRPDVQQEAHQTQPSLVEEPPTRPPTTTSQSPQTISSEHTGEPANSTLPVGADPNERGEQVKSSEQSEVSRPPDVQQEVQQTQPNSIEEPTVVASTTLSPTVLEDLSPTSEASNITSKQPNQVTFEIESSTKDDPQAATVSDSVTVVAAVDGQDEYQPQAHSERPAQANIEPTSENKLNSSHETTTIASLDEVAVESNPTEPTNAATETSAVEHTADLNQTDESVSSASKSTDSTEPAGSGTPHATNDKQHETQSASVEEETDLRTTKSAASNGVTEPNSRAEEDIGSETSSKLGQSSNEEGVETSTEGQQMETSDKIAPNVEHTDAESSSVVESGGSEAARNNTDTDTHSERPQSDEFVTSPTVASSVVTDESDKEVAEIGEPETSSKSPEENNTQSVTERPNVDEDDKPTVETSSPVVSSAPNSQLEVSSDGLTESPTVAPDASSKDDQSSLAGDRPEDTAKSTLNGPLDLSEPTEAPNAVRSDANHIEGGEKEPEVRASTESSREELAVSQASVGVDDNAGGQSYSSVGPDHQDKIGESQVVKSSNSDKAKDEEDHSTGQAPVGAVEAVEEVSSAPVQQSDHSQADKTETSTAGSSDTLGTDDPASSPPPPPPPQPPPPSPPLDSSSDIGSSKSEEVATEQNPSDYTEQHPSSVEPAVSDADSVSEKEQVEDRTESTTHSSQVDETIAAEAQRDSLVETTSGRPNTDADTLQLQQETDASGATDNSAQPATPLAQLEGPIDRSEYSTQATNLGQEDVAVQSSSAPPHSSQPLHTETESVGGDESSTSSMSPVDLDDVALPKGDANESSDAKTEPGSTSSDQSTDSGAASVTPPLSVTPETNQEPSASEASSTTQDPQAAVIAHIETKRDTHLEDAEDDTLLSARSEHTSTPTLESDEVAAELITGAPLSDMPPPTTRATDEEPSQVERGAQVPSADHALFVLHPIVDQTEIPVKTPRTGIIKQRANKVVGYIGNGLRTMAQKVSPAAAWIREHLG